MTKKVHIRTFGCQMNDRDSEALTGLFLQEGYSLTQQLDEADVILVNTCSVRDHAENRAISFLGSIKNVTRSQSHSSAPLRTGKVTRNLRNTHEARRTTSIKPVIGLIGCMAKNRGQELFKKMPHIDLICAPHRLGNIPYYIERIQSERKRIIDLQETQRDESFYEAPFRIEHDHAQVVISTGCSNHCTYCVVPYVRGPLCLRRPANIIKEVQRNVALGITRITLLGQNVNDYDWRPVCAEEGSRTTFVNLLRQVTAVEGITEIDFITSHPKNTSKELFALMAETPKIRKHIHLPFQSGSDRILKMMNRGYTKNEYLTLVNEYKRIINGTISTDVIVGFPTETNEDFLHTKDILERVRFDYAYLFKYSTRLNIEGAAFDDTVPQEVKNSRHTILLELQKKISMTKKQQAISRG